MITENVALAMIATAGPIVTTIVTYLLARNRGVTAGAKRDEKIVEVSAAVVEVKEAVQQLDAVGNVAALVAAVPPEVHREAVELQRRVTELELENRKLRGGE